MLRLVAARLAQAPGGSTAYRYGGEEFALVFPGKGAEECLPHLEELREVVETSRFTMRRRFRPRAKAKADKGRKIKPSITITRPIATIKSLIASVERQVDRLFDCLCCSRTDC